MKQYTVAVLGATGAVGQEMMKILAERNFPVGKLIPLASARSAGKTVTFKGEEVTIQEARDDAFEGVDIVLGAAENDIAKRFAPAIVKAGAVFVDNSSAFRLDENVPLVVPEINPQDVKNHHGIISNPNCSTIITVTAVNALNAISPIRTMTASTYQAVSGAGAGGPVELMGEVEALLKGESYQPTVFSHQSAFNLIPQIDVFKDNLYTKEEMKMIDETKKIMSDDSMRITATTIRVPVYRSHAESVNVEFEDEISVEKAREVLAAFPGVTLTDNPDEQIYPMRLETSGKDDVEVGRIRKDYSTDNALNFWVCGDQIRKGAALNALQIAEYMINNEMV